MGIIPPQGVMGIQNYAQVNNSGNPIHLAFGTEAVAHVEIGLKSVRTELASVEHNEEALNLNLDLLDEKREQVLKRTEDY